MHKFTTTALAVALGLAWSTMPVIAADDKSVKEKAADTKDTVKEKTSEAWDKTKEKTSEAWDKTKEKTGEAKDKVKAKVSGDKAEDKAERAKDKAEAKGDTVGNKVDRGVDKTKAKAREAKDKVAGKMESSDDVRQAQTALKDKGHDPGPIDGIHGPRTSAALRSYQKAENIKVTGRLDSDTKSHLTGSADDDAVGLDNDDAAGRRKHQPDAASAGRDGFALDASAARGEAAKALTLTRGAGVHASAPPRRASGGFFARRVDSGAPLR